jgi:hypothetical protein
VNLKNRILPQMQKCTLNTSSSCHAEHHTTSILVTLNSPTMSQCSLFGFEAEPYLKLICLYEFYMRPIKRQTLHFCNAFRSNKWHSFSITVSFKISEWLRCNLFTVCLVTSWYYKVVETFRNSYWNHWFTTVVHESTSHLCWATRIQPPQSLVLF